MSTGLKLKKRVRKYDEGDKIKLPGTDGEETEGPNMDFAALGEAASGVAGNLMATRKKEGIEVVSTEKAVATNALKGAGYGATIGSAIPIPGMTVVGAAAGAVIGGAVGYFGAGSAQEKAKAEIDRRYGGRVEEINAQAGQAYGQNYEQANIPMGRNGLKVKKQGCGCGHKKFELGGQTDGPRTKKTAVAQAQPSQNASPDGRPPIGYSATGKAVYAGANASTAHGRNGGYLPQTTNTAPAFQASNGLKQAGTPHPSVDQRDFYETVKRHSTMVNARLEAGMDWSEDQHKEWWRSNVKGGQHQGPSYESSWLTAKRRHESFKQQAADVRQNSQQVLQETGRIGGDRNANPNLRIGQVNASGIEIDRRGGSIPVRRGGGLLPGKY
jgi:hypothetical protein